MAIIPPTALPFIAHHSSHSSKSFFPFLLCLFPLSTGPLVPFGSSILWHQQLCLLISKPLFIYSFFHIKNIKEVNTTDLIHSLWSAQVVFSLSPVHSGRCDCCLCGQNCSCFQVWMENNCGFSQVSHWSLPNTKKHLFYDSDVVNVMFPTT